LSERRKWNWELQVERQFGVRRKVWRGRKLERRAKLEKEVKLGKELGMEVRGGREKWNKEVEGKGKLGRELEV
jgi:hypothetical protein